MSVVGHGTNFMGTSYIFIQKLPHWQCIKHSGKAKLHCLAKHPHEMLIASIANLSESAGYTSWLTIKCHDMTKHEMSWLKRHSYSLNKNHQMSPDVAK